MPMTNTAPFPQIPRTASATCTAAATIADNNPANTVLLCTAGVNGAVLTKLTAVPRSTVSATALLVFVQKQGLTTKELKDTITMPAGTVSTTAAVRPTTFGYTELATLRLEAGDKVFVGAMVALAAGIVFSAEFSDY